MSRGKITLAHCRRGQVPLGLAKAIRMGKVVGLPRKRISISPEEANLLNSRKELADKASPKELPRAACTSSLDFWNRLSIPHDTGSGPRRGRGRRVEEALYLSMRSPPSRSLAEGTCFGKDRDFHMRRCPMDSI